MQGNQFETVLQPRAFALIAMSLYADAAANLLIQCVASARANDCYYRVSTVHIEFNNYSACIFLLKLRIFNK